MTLLYDFEFHNSTAAPGLVELGVALWPSGSL